MRLLKRIWRMLAGQCITCGTQLTEFERIYHYWHCLGCTAGMDE